MVDLSLLQDFITESREHLEEVESSLLRLKKEPDNIDILNDIFRSMHTIKGASQFIGLERISEISHKLENLLDLLRQGKKQLNQDIIDILIEGKDRIMNFTDELKRFKIEENEIDGLIAQIKSLIEGKDKEEKVAEEKIEDISMKALEVEETVDVSDEKPETETLEGETYGEEYDEELFNIFIQQMKENISFLRFQINELDASPNKAEVLDRCADSIKSLQSAANYMSYEKLTQLYKNWGAKIDKAKEELSLGKEISFDFMNAYLDKIVETFPQIEEIEIEDEEAALTPNDKMETGGEVSVLLADEELDLSEDVIEAEEAKAGAEEVVGVEDKLEEDREEALTLVEEAKTAPETAGLIPDDKQLFDKLNGVFDFPMDEDLDAGAEPLNSVIEEMLFAEDEEKSEEPPSIQEVDSKVSAQTQMRIKIPLTLAIIQVFLVRVGEGLFAIPLSAVEETLRIFKAETSSIEGAEVIHLRDTILPIFRLSDIFGIDADSQDEDKQFVVIVSTGMQQIGLVVDELMRQEEVVIKPLVDYLQKKNGFSGATIIGDGRISLVLDIYELVQIITEKQIKRHKCLKRTRYDHSM